MTGAELLGLAMLLVMLGAIFIGLPISFTLLFLALMFGYVGMGERVFAVAFDLLVEDVELGRGVDA